MTQPKNFNRLARMLMMQAELQSKLGNDMMINDNWIGWQHYINLMSLALIDEVMEMLRETAYKNPEFIKGGWKRGQKIQLKKARSELIDAWFFMLNLSIALGLDSEDIYKMYCHKYRLNLKRIDKKY